MKPELSYIEINKHSWNSRVETHLQSDFYDVKGFIEGNTSLKEIELALLGDVNGKSILHLQCHFGQDTISLSRLGANVIGIDLSDKAIENAIRLAKETGCNTEFICADLYDLPNHLDEQYDIVFTSYGTIGWLPDLNKWAEIIAKYLKPKGQFIFVEFHPVVWMFDDNFERIAYHYHNTGPIVETENGTYADKNAALQLQYIAWNHGLGEVINSLIKNGMQIKALDEYDYSPYNCFNKTVEFAPNKFRITHLDNKIPMVYSVVATKGA